MNTIKSSELIAIGEVGTIVLYRKGLSIKLVCAHQSPPLPSLVGLEFRTQIKA